MLRGVAFVTEDAAGRNAAKKACVSLGDGGYETAVKTKHAALEGILQDWLYLADDYLTAQRLADAGAKTCGFLHENNRQERFGGFKYLFDEIPEVDADSYNKAWERLSGLPWTIAKTNRLLIRETTTDDLDALYDIYSEPSVTEFQDGLLEDRDAEKRYMEDYIKNIYGLMGFGIWSLVRLEDGILIGRAGLSAAKGYDKTELGFTVGVPWQRQGYAFEACSQILLFAGWVLGLDRVYANVREGNTASERLCEKLGFVKDTEPGRDGHIRYVKRL